MALGYHMLPHEIEWVSENQPFQASYELQCLEEHPTSEPRWIVSLQDAGRSEAGDPPMAASHRKPVLLVFLCGVIDT